MMPPLCSIFVDGLPRSSRTTRNALRSGAAHQIEHERRFFPCCVSSCRRLRRSMNASSGAICSSFATLRPRVFDRGDRGVVTAGEALLQLLDGGREVVDGQARVAHRKFQACSRVVLICVSSERSTMCPANPPTSLAKPMTADTENAPASMVGMGPSAPMIFWNTETGCSPAADSRASSVRPTLAHAGDHLTGRGRLLAGGRHPLHQDVQVRAGVAEVLRQAGELLRRVGDDRLEFGVVDAELDERPASRVVVESAIDVYHADTHRRQHVRCRLRGAAADVPACRLLDPGPQHLLGLR
jgi:hypothetical protein